VRLLNYPKIEELMDIKNVSDVEELGNSEFKIRFKDMNEATQNIVEKSVSKNWKLDEIRAEKCSLNEIFAMLSK
jgi:ABC-2 type transport system ATP-binding protein